MRESVSEKEKGEREREREAEKDRERDSLCFTTKPLKSQSKALAYEDNISLFDY